MIPEKADIHGKLNTVRIVNVRFIWYYNKLSRMTRAYESDRKVGAGKSKPSRGAEKDGEAWVVLSAIHRDA